jgi:4-alpha-glucanotransferase
MKISFSIHYHTVWGEQLCLLGNTPELGNDIVQQALQMTWQEGDLWYGAIELPSQSPFTLQYQYLLKKEGTTLYDGTLRTVAITTDPPQLLQLVDTWIDAGAIEHAWTTAPFQQVFFPKEMLPFEDANTPVTHVFRVKAPLLPFRQTMCIQGSDALLGNWHTQWPVMMRYEPDGWYTARMDLREATSFPIFYKYAVYDWQTHTFISYEKGDNRKVEVGIAAGQQVIVQDGLAHLDHIPWKGTGVAIPVFSLRSAESFGTGSFTDLRLLVDWAVKIGLQLIQLLPVNDTSATLTWEDSYPYAAISAFALHPLYIDLQKVGLLDKAHPLQQQYPALQQQLNKLDEMDYEAVLQFKNAYLDALYQQQFETPWKTADYDSWFQQNNHWLIPYAVFCYLKSKYGTCDFTQWPDYQVYDTDKMKVLLQPESEAYQKIQCIYFIQYHLHLQLQDAATYARSKGVVLKGDIPIGIFRYSADAWSNPHLFNSTVQVGAPPDSFAMHGQN